MRRITRAEVTITASAKPEAASISDYFLTPASIADARAFAEAHPVWGWCEATVCVRFHALTIELSHPAGSYEDEAAFRASDDFAAMVKGALCLLDDAVTDIVEALSQPAPAAQES